MTVYYNGQRLLVPHKNQRGEMVRVDGGLLYEFPGRLKSHDISVIDKYVNWWHKNLENWINKKGHTNPFGPFENKHNRDI